MAEKREKMEEMETAVTEAEENTAVAAEAEKPEAIAEAEAGKAETAAEAEAGKAEATVAAHTGETGEPKTADTANDGDGQEENKTDAYEEMEDRFFLEYFDSNRVLASAQRLDYVYLRFIETGERHSESERGVYISELAESTGFPINRISSMMTRLQDKGYIIWKTNTEKNRTYVELTGKAKEALASDMDRNWKLYKAIRENISMEDLVVTARTMHKISELLAGEK